MINVKKIIGFIQFKFIVFQHYSAEFNNYKYFKQNWKLKNLEKKIFYKNLHFIYNRKQKNKTS